MLNRFNHIFYAGVLLASITNYSSLIASENHPENNKNHATSNPKFSKADIEELIEFSNCVSNSMNKRLEHISNHNKAKDSLAIDFRNQYKLINSGFKTIASSIKICIASMALKQTEVDLKLIGEILTQISDNTFSSAKAISNQNETEIKLNCFDEKPGKNYDKIITMPPIEIKEIFPEIKLLKEYFSDRLNIEKYQDENHIANLTRLKLAIIINQKKQYMNFAQKFIPLLKNSNDHPRELNAIEEIIGWFNSSIHKDQINLYKSELMIKITDKKLSNTLPNDSDIYTELPYLYRLTKSGQTKSHFLFGTNHYLKIELISPEAIKIMKNCDKLFIESLDENEESTNDVIKSFIEKHYQQDLNQNDWMNHLTTKQLETLNKLYKEFNIEAEKMNHLPTTLAMAILREYLSSIKHDFFIERSKYYMDAEIVDYFQLNKKNVEGLENSQSIYGAIISTIEHDNKNHEEKNETISEAQQLLEDISNVVNDTTESNAKWSNITTDYLLSNTIVLPSAMSRREILDKNVHKELNEDSDKSSLFVVGAAHLLGEGGLIEQLLQQEYTVEKFEFGKFNKL